MPGDEDIKEVQRPGGRSDTTDPPTFYEQIQEGGKPVYLCYTNHYFTMPFVTGDDEIHVPMPRTLWPLAGPFTTDDAMSHSELWAAIRQFLHDHVDFQDDRLYDVTTGWVFASWIPERFNAVPYIYVLGPLKSGKTRVLDCLRLLCLRGLEVPSISGAGLFRIMEEYHPTLLIDEAQFLGSDTMTEARGVLNAGYRRGQYAVRMVPDQNNRFTPRMFDVFGFKALASVKPQRNTLESRCIVIHMDKAVRTIRFTLDETRAATIRTQLLLWRLAQLAQLEDSEDSERLGETPPEELTFADGRFVEKFYPLYAVSNMGRTAILQYARSLYQTEQDADESSIEAEVTLALLECQDAIHNGVVKASDIRDEFNKGRAEKERWKTASVSSIVRRLGLHKKRTTDGSAGYLWDEANIRRKMRRYNLTPSLLKPSEPSERSEPSEPVNIDRYFPEGPE
jgi:hypothetical protein